jgi:hypothetical protein
MKADSPQDAAPHSSSPAPAVLPSGTTGVTRLERPGGPAPVAAPPPDLPALPDFLGGSETRLRDLLAFGMAVEGGKPLPADGVEGLRRKADAELQAHAFRVLHNRVEAIRREAMDEQLARTARGVSFSSAVLANLLALLLVAAGVTLVWLASPHLFPGR